MHYQVKFTSSKKTKESGISMLYNWEFYVIMYVEGIIDVCLHLKILNILSKFNQELDNFQVWFSSIVKLQEGTRLLELCSVQDIY